MSQHISSLKKETRIGLITIKKINDERIGVLLVFRGKVIEGFSIILFKTLFELSTSIISTKYYGELKYLIMLPLNLEISKLSDLFLRILKPLMIIDNNLELKRCIGLNKDDCQAILNHFIKHISHEVLEFSRKLIAEICSLIKSIEERR